MVEIKHEFLETQQANNAETPRPERDREAEAEAAADVQAQVEKQLEEDNAAANVASENQALLAAKRARGVAIPSSDTSVTDSEEEADIAAIQQEIRSPKATTLLGRLGSSKMLRGLAAVVGLFSAGQTFKNPINVLEQTRETMEQTSRAETALQLSFQGIGERNLSETVKMEEGEMSRQDLKDTIDDAATTRMKEVGFYNAVKDYVVISDTEHGDHVDAGMLLDLYGNQLEYNRTASVKEMANFQLLVDDRSPGEQNVIGDIIRDTLTELPGGAAKASPDSLVGISWEGSEHFQGRYSADELKHFYQSVYETERSTLDNLMDRVHYDSLNPEEQQAVEHQLHNVGQHIVDTAISQARVGDLISSEAIGNVEESNIHLLFDGVILADGTEQAPLINTWHVNQTTLDNSLKNFDTLAHQIGAEPIQAEGLMGAHHDAATDWYKSLVHDKVEKNGFFTHKIWTQVDQGNGPVEKSYDVTLQ